jgi:hypothetical protein
MLGRFEYLFDWSRLDHLAEVHDGHIISNLGNDPKVVSDENYRHLILVSQLQKQVQYLGLGGHVQSRGWLVCDQYPWVSA